MTDPRERFIEDNPEALDWEREPRTPEDRKRARELFRWISCH
ncbi:MAG TPA: hypothetical protein P5217_05955 [Methanoregulaceae archaeon]|nr:hypothetical protein [Methanoregulaceae archaeon]HPD75581.1 hypothetical protein [Methanoregulaceae archaeon]HRY75806.1 hypothetical protein [Methanoregulaceae archaeon]